MGMIRERKGSREALVLSRESIPEIDSRLQTQYLRLKK